MLHRFRRITSDTWFALGLEFFAIVLGVLFALNVDEWREQRQIAEMNAIAVERLNDEILRNFEELERSARVTEERYSRLAALNVGTDGPFSEKLAQFGGYHFPDLKHSVWERMGHDTLANRIDPLYIDGATELYNQNRLLDYLSEQIFDLTVSETFHDAALAPQPWTISKTVMLQQIQWQREALARYEDFIRRHMPARTDDVMSTSEE
ncbi:MAG: hypothetical protein KY410_05580 [Proteobacteria bacterium]|nr:hypothetical protein [Pseudomonadota bacterium]